MKNVFLIILVAIFATVGNAAVVHVRQQTVAGSQTNELFYTTRETANSYTTQTAPAISGYVFTHWSIEPASTNVFVCRDDWGRALDAASYRLYEDVTLTANYLPESFDADDDGVADGWELYWYGSLDVSDNIDTDGDGMAFAEELAAGTNPYFPDAFSSGGVVVLQGDAVQYNPKNMHYCVIRSEPEGKLFSTISNLVVAGRSVNTPSCSSTNSTFAYWTQDGVRIADEFGRAVEQITFVMPTNETELVAVCENDATRRLQFFWYGTTDVALDSDTDGDGLIFSEELECGTNPLFPDIFVAGGVTALLSGVMQYTNVTHQSGDTEDKYSYVIRSEPEGKLFSTISNRVVAGKTLTTPSCSSTNSTFAYWTQDGVRMADEFGRAVEQITFVMPTNATELIAVCELDAARRQQLYWYGNTEIALDSDTDGDGLTLSEELDAGSNPHLSDRYLAGGVERYSGAVHEVNLQPFEQETGAVVDGAYVQMFTSPMAGNLDASMTFGANASPAVVDWNGDGLDDLIIAFTGGARLYLNVGAVNNPEFEMEDLPANMVTAFDDMDYPIVAGDGTNGVYVSDNGGEIIFYGFAHQRWFETELEGVPAICGGTLVALTGNGWIDSVDVETCPILDVPVENGWSITCADSDSDGRVDILASDIDGRIWHYRNMGDSRFVLQDKVWGGSCPGFALGLTLAAWDADGDGDADCLCGTAEGKLMLLKNPKVGRPIGLTGLSGVDNALLAWSPNIQPQIRGYRVYRSVAGENAYENLVMPYVPLPEYRDVPSATTAYDYKVSAVSRFYTAGNSTPVLRESAATDPVRVNLGTVSLSPGDAAAFGGMNVDVSLSMENSLGVGASGGEIVVKYDSLLTPVDVKPSGLTEKAEFSWTKDDVAGTLTISITGGTIDAGSGTFFTLVFGTQDVEEETSASITLASASLKSAEGANIVVVLPEAGSSSGGTITITPFEEDEEEAEDIGKDLPKPSDIPDEGDDNNIDEEDVENNDDVDKDESQIEIRGYGGQAGLVVGIAKATVGKTEIVTLPVGIRSLNFSHWWGGSGNLNVSVSRTTLKFTYDPVLLEPTGVEGLLGTAWTWSAENGVLAVKGRATSGNLSLGSLPTSRTQYPLKLTFRVLEQYSKHEALVGFGDVILATTSFRKVYTPIRHFGGVAIKYTRPQGDSTIVAPYSLGDINGDGKLTRTDLNRMANIVGLLGFFATRNEIRAGDYNGNGWLDHGDYQLMRQHFRKLGVVANGESGQGGGRW